MQGMIDLQGLTKGFGQALAVDGLTMRIEEGRTLGFFGPEGAGKTTTIKMMLGFLKPDAGQGQIKELDIIQDSVRIRELVGYLPETNQFYDYMTLEELLQFTSSFYPGWNHQLAAEFIEYFQLPKKKRMGSLYQEDKRLISLVLALAPEPELLILDQPTTGLSTIMKQRLLSLIKERLSAAGMTILYASDSFSEIKSVADQVAFIHQGRLLSVRGRDQLTTESTSVRVVFQQEPDPELLEDPAVEEYTREDKAFIFSVRQNLLGFLEQLELEPHFALDIIEESPEQIIQQQMRGDGDEEGFTL